MTNTTTVLNVIASAADDFDHLKRTALFVFGNECEDQTRDDTDRWAWLLTQEVATDDAVMADSVAHPDFSDPEDWTEYLRAFEQFDAATSGYHN